ncbi:MAG TPA: GNAT family N-acetyltransferase [Actinomycetota bacterium]|nr:GNAT family N-acetyltransferase [Actinomycetota bacterium]
MLIREANADDWPNVVALLAELGRPDVRGAPEEDEARELFLSYLGRPDAVALVAEDGDRVAGFLDMEYRVRLNFTTPQAWIPDLIVDEDSRGVGIGRALLEQAEELARERGCWSMTLESATWRERAHAFYLREGWKETGKSFSKVLADVVWPPPPR